MQSERGEQMGPAHRCGQRTHRVADETHHRQQSGEGLWSSKDGIYNFGVYRMRDEEQRGHGRDVTVSSKYDDPHQKNHTARGAVQQHVAHADAECELAEWRELVDAQRQAH